MAIFDNKSEEKKFAEAVERRDYHSIVAIGKEMLRKGSSNVSVLNEVVDAYLKLGKKSDAVKLLVDHGQSRIKEGFYDTAIIVLKKALKIDSLNEEAAILLSDVYLKKNLQYESFLVVKEIFDALREKGSLKEKVKKAYFDRLKQLLDTAEELKSDNVTDLLLYFSNLARNLLGADRCSLFLADENEKVLWTKVAHGVDEIRIPWDRGVAGKVYTEGKPLVINDAYSSPYFNKEVDKKTGYVTRNILTVPVISTSGKVIGVYQAINKRGGDFSDIDLEIFSFLSEYAAKVLSGKEEMPNQMPSSEVAEGQKVNTAELLSAMLTTGVKDIMNKAIKELKSLKGDNFSRDKVASVIKELEVAMENLSLIQSEGIGKSDEEDDVFQSVKDAVDSVSRENGAEIKLQIPDESFIVLVDRFLFSELIKNVLRNCVYRKTSDSNISFKLLEKRELDDRVTFTFVAEDNGNPISIPEKEKIFDYEESLVNRSSLYVPRQIARMMGGDVWIESNDLTKIFVKVSPSKVQYKISRYY